jgi:hypothetical protein
VAGGLISRYHARLTCHRQALPRACVHVHHAYNDSNRLQRDTDMTTKPSLNTLLQQFETEQAQRKLPDFGPGDTVIVNVKVKEGNRERVQAYEGVVIGKKNAGLNSSFTVRKI